MRISSRSASAISRCSRVAGCPSGRCQYCCRNAGVSGGTRCGKGGHQGQKLPITSYLPKNDLEGLGGLRGQVRLVGHQCNVIALWTRGPRGSGGPGVTRCVPVPPQPAPLYRDLDVSIRQGSSLSPWGVGQGVVEPTAIGAHLHRERGRIGMAAGKGRGGMGWAKGRG